ncbi:MAG: hypothetical protein Q9195_007168 [Heterodermia aff. obscurata]
MRACNPLKADTEQLVNHTADGIRLNLKPGNRESALIKSVKVQTRDIVIRVTIPKRTGRKRKRGSDGPFWTPSGSPARLPANSSPSPSVASQAKRFLRSLQDNEGQYRIEVVGPVTNTYRFRDLPDFVFSTAGSPFMNQMRDKILPGDYMKWKDFIFDSSKGVKPNTEIIPPPIGTVLELPFNYAYLENNMVRTAYSATGEPVTQNVSLPRRQENQHTPWDEPIVPTGPSSALPPLTSLEPPMRRLIIAARDLFAKRPIYTRRALFNFLPARDLAIIGQNATKHIPQFVGYVFIGGPWSKAIIRFGVDPRKDRELRMYQTMTFHLDEPVRKYDKNTGRVPKKPGEFMRYMGKQADSHVFDGTKAYTEGKVWQFCDITDPLLTPLTTIDDLREECHLESDGWFHNGTLAKLKVIMRQKLVKLWKGEEVDESVFDRVLALPEIYNTSNSMLFTTRYYKRGLGKEEARMVELIRAVAIRTTDDSVLSAKDREAGQNLGNGEPTENGEIDEAEVEALNQHGSPRQANRSEKEPPGRLEPDGDMNEHDGEQTDLDAMLIDEQLDPVP